MRDEVVNALVAVAQLAFALAGIVLMALYDERHVVPLLGLPHRLLEARKAHQAHGRG